MSEQDILHLRALEGSQISVALTDGSRIDNCQLVSAGRHGLKTLWVFSSGIDVFLPGADVIQVWESPPPDRRGSRAA